ncbi:MAG: polymer-forming cytoskeletal protein [Burkholderiaceae bacterium]
MSTASRDEASASPDDTPDLSAFEPLRAAEQLVLRAWRDDDIARVGLRRPIVPSSDITVRGAFVAQLARGSADGRLAPRSVQIVGAWIEGRMDLRDAHVGESLWFYRCVFNATPRLDGARVSGSVSFPGCLLPGLRAEDAVIGGVLALNSGCVVRTEVRLARALIGHDLNCERLQLRSAEDSDTPIRRRISAEGARIDGNALLTGGLESDGDLRLVGLRVGGDLRATRARLSGEIDDEGFRGDALNLDLARVAGSVYLDQGFSASGLVRLRQARIQGDLDCSGAAFDALGDMAWRGATTVALDQARIGGTLVLAQQSMPLQGVSLAAAEAQALADDDTTWGEDLTLDGFRYRRFARTAPTQADFRVDWLKRQQTAHLGRDFRPQPWQQAIEALRGGSQEHAARDVAIARERHLRQVGRVGMGLPRPLRALARAGHLLVDGLMGFGHKPLRLVAALALLWLACGLVYWAAAENGAIAPLNPAVYNDPRLAACRTGDAAGASWTHCPQLPPEHPAFRPFAYSLDVLLPFANLQQRQTWTSLDSHGADASRAAASQAWGVASRWLAWYQGLFGWLAIALLGWWALRRSTRGG